MKSGAEKTSVPLIFVLSVRRLSLYSSGRTGAAGVSETVLASALKSKFSARYVTDFSGAHSLYPVPDGSIRHVPTPIS